MRYLVVIDGEHYPAVVQAAVRAVAANDEVVAAVLAGGREKLPAGGLASLDGVEVITGDDGRRALDRALRTFRPDAVVDLSDEPVLDYRRRHEFAAVALFNGVAYHGADFAFEPPDRPPLCAVPSIAVIGTGKRTGKTALAGLFARTLKDRGRRPVVVAMGRGGPEEPEVLRGDDLDLTATDLVAFADQGKHAASDYIEDALLARVPTVGCRRCGGGLAGDVATSNVEAGVAVANGLGGDIALLEGSGSAIPPVRADVTVLAVPASIPPEYLTGYFGPYRLLLTDLAVVTMCEEPFGSPSRVSHTTSLIRDSFRIGGGPGSEGEIQVIRTVFRPTPTRSVEGRSVIVATTAPAEIGDVLTDHLSREHGCEVVAITHALSDRERLQAELDSAEQAEVLLCEIKAAGIDVAARRALDRGMDVVFMDNAPVGIDGDDLTAAVLDAAARADARFEQVTT